MEDTHLQQKLLTALTPDQRDQALIQYRIIQPYLERQKTLKTICEDHHIPLRTVRSWISLYRKYGLAGLSRRTRSDKGKNRGITVELRQLIEGLHLKSSHLSHATIYRQVKKMQEEKKLPYPKYRTVCTILNQLPQPMTTLAHQGSKAYQQRYDLLYRHEAEHPNEIWQADHAELDIILLNSQGKLQRPWLTIIFDDYSRAIAGYELSFTAPSALKTSLCLRVAIWRKEEPLWSICGVPDRLYTDHGTDFTSIHLEQVCVDLKINLIFSQIGQPRGRGKIERFFLTLNQLLLSELPGYIKNKKTAPQLTLTALDILLQKFIIDYNHTEHSQTGFAPQRRWEHQGFLPHLPESIEKLDLLLLTVRKSRKIMRDGIHFQGLRYIDTVLADYVGENVIIRYDPVNLTSIRVFYKEGFLCQPVCQELSNQSVGLKEIQAARHHKKRILREEINQRLSLVDAILSTKKEFSHEHLMISNPPNTNVQPIKLKLYESDT